MINKRNFLLGLGSGLILGSVLLQLMLAANPEQPKSTRSDLSSYTVEQLEGAAEKLNMRLVSADSKVYTENQLNDLFKAKEAEWRASLPSVEQKQTNDNAVSASSNEEQTEAPKKTLKIVAGMTLIKVSDKLEELGIITSSEKFVEYGKKHQINSKIRTGFYELSADQTFAQIAKIITTKP